MFRSALLKLTGVYLLIIVSISLFFSLNLYRISSHEMDNSFKRQQNNIERRIKGGPGPLINQDFLDERARILNEGQNNIVWQLVYTNFVILVLGGALSYILARLTLRPIEEAHESQVRFTSDASHELRSPLAAMKAEIEVALRDPKFSKEEAKALLKSNLEEVERLKVLSEGLLELARDNGAEMQKEGVKIEEFVSAAIKNVSKKAKTKNISIEKSVNGFSVVGNKESLTELITILLDNAVKYSEKETKICLSAEKQNKVAIITVVDEGVGIAEKDLPYIFDRFYRADSSRSKTGADGYGLGLSIAKKIVDANGGKIFVESEINKGSTFRLELPLVES